MSTTTVGGLPNGKSPSDAFLQQSEVDLISNTIEGILAGLVSIDLTGLASPVTLDTTLGSAPVAQARNMVVTCTGALTANMTVNFPNWAGKTWIVINNTTGAFTLTCKVSGQTGVVISQGFEAILYGNGTDVARVTGDASVTALIRGTIGPNASQQHTLPAVASDTLAVLGAAQTFTGQVTFSNGTAPILVAKLGPTSGQQHSIPAVSSDTFVLLGATQTLAAKTLTAAILAGGVSISGAIVGNLTPVTFGRFAKTMSDADYTLANTEYSKRHLELNAGSLTATRNIILPATDGAEWVVFNNTTGGQALIVKTPSGTGPTIANGKTAIVRCDGTNILRVTPDA